LIWLLRSQEQELASVGRGLQGPVVNDQLIRSPGEFGIDREVGSAVVLTRKFRAGMGKPLFVQLWLVPAWVLLGLCRALVLILSFQRLVRWFGLVKSEAVNDFSIRQAQAQRASRIGEVIRLAARHTPWNSNCFAQALAAHLMLSVYRIPHSLFLGVAREASTHAVLAHAWTVAGSVPVTGQEISDRYTVVLCFVSSHPGVGQG
jgi:hypothetical protein